MVARVPSGRDFCVTDSAQKYEPCCYVVSLSEFPHKGEPTINRVYSTKGMEIVTPYEREGRAINPFRAAVPFWEQIT